MARHSGVDPMSAALDGRLALVTGARGDIGTATAVRLAAAGADLILTDIAEGIEQVADLCRASRDGCDVRSFTLDVTDEQSVSDLFGELAQAGRTADLLFNNAGYQGEFASVQDYHVNDMRAVLEVNVVGVFNMLTSFARQVIAAGVPASVVNTASMAQTGAPNMVAYSASKAAVVALTRSAALDLAAHNIRVNSISPAFIGPGRMWDRQVELQAEAPSNHFANEPALVAEQMISSVPMQRYGTLDEVAAGAVFLLSDQASYVTGFDLHISGGLI